MRQIDLTKGVKALHDRLLHEIRREASNHNSNLHAIASALTLLLFGHNPILEGHVQNAAWDAVRAVKQAATQGKPDMTDSEVAEAFLAKVPVFFAEMPVRNQFFADRYEAAPAADLSEAAPAA